MACEYKVKSNNYEAYRGPANDNCDMVNLDLFALCLLEHFLLKKLNATMSEKITSTSGCFAFFRLAGGSVSVSDLRFFFLRFVLVSDSASTNVALALLPDEDGLASSLELFDERPCTGGNRLRGLRVCRVDVTAIQAQSAVIDDLGVRATHANTLLAIGILASAPSRVVGHREMQEMMQDDFFEVRF